MYCPNCKAINQEGTGFCTRCGTDIALVPDAISGKIDPPQLDERMVALFKDYYRGRRGILIGGVLSATMMMKLAWVYLTGFSPDFLPYFLIALVAGVATLVWGLVKWNNSSSEIKAIERVRQIEMLHPSRKHVELQSNESIIDQVALPASATEHTTRNLEERVYAPSVENKTKV